MIFFFFTVGTGFVLDIAANGVKLRLDKQKNALTVLVYHSSSTT